MSYVDTSVLVSFYCPEARSPRVDQVLAQTSVRGVSWLVEAEFIATVSAKVRARQLASSDAISIRERFQHHLADAVFVLWSLGREEYARAGRFLGDATLGLRTLDALHLAVAAGRGAELITADRQLARAAERLKLQVRRVA